MGQPPWSVDRGPRMNLAIGQLIDFIGRIANKFFYLFVAHADLNFWVAQGVVDGIRECQNIFISKPDNQTHKNNQNNQNAIENHVQFFHTFETVWINRVVLFQSMLSLATIYFQGLQVFITLTLT